MWTRYADTSGALLILCLLLFPGCRQSGLHHFSHADPESKGWSSEKLKELEAHLEASGASSMLILVGGEIIFQWGDIHHKHSIHSVRKALLNSLYGIAIEQGKIDTSATLGELGIDDIPPGLTEQEKAARVADLLRSRSGIYHPAAAVSQAMLRNMPERGSHAPGEHYYYNNWDFNVLGSILEDATGKSIYRLFLKHIARPTGMHNYRGRFTSIDAEAEKRELGPVDGFYQYEPSTSDFPAYHFRMSAYDLAIYGMLYLNQGMWKGDELVPGQWIHASTQVSSVQNPEYGLSYGMLWKVLVPDSSTIRNSFYHTGLGIHMLGIYPDMDMVMVHRVDTEKHRNYQGSDFYTMLGLLFQSRK